jgi:hypothetical protein
MKNKLYLPLANRQSQPYVGSLIIAAPIDRAGVRPLLSAPQNRIMNAIAAHKHEVERLLEHLSGDLAFSKMNFLALVNAYITHLDTNCSEISARRRRREINGELNMEPTLTQNSAVYYAQHKTSKHRAALFRKFRVAARKQGPDVRRQSTCRDLSIVQRLHEDNGR